MVLIRDRRSGQGTEREPGDGGCRFGVSEPIEQGGEHSQRGTDMGSVARLVVITDRQREVLQRG